MYAPDTKLKLKVPKDPDEETGEPFAYNEVRVVGPSPVSHADKGDWKGPDAEGVILVPLTNFGSTLDEPFGKVRSLFEVTEIPEKVTEVAAPVRVINATTAEAGPTPEEVFAQEAPASGPSERALRRAAREESPLGEPGGPPEAQGPLGDVQPEPEDRIVVDPPRPASPLD